jgi:hypothetical protein
MGGRGAAIQPRIPDPAAAGAAAPPLIPNPAYASPEQSWHRAVRADRDPADRGNTARDSYRTSRSCSASFSGA